MESTWPPSIAYGSTLRKGKGKAVFLPYPLLEGGALTPATLRERHGRLEWVTAQNFSPDRQRLLHGRSVRNGGPTFLRAYYPDVDVPAELIRDASPDFSNTEFSAEGSITTEPTHSPARTFRTPICQIVPSPVSDDPNRGDFRTSASRQSRSCEAETVIAVLRTYSSESLLSLSSPVSAPRKTTALPEIKDIGSFDRLSFDGHAAVDVQFHCALENILLVNNLGYAFGHALLGGDNPIKFYDGVSEPDYLSDGFWRIASGRPAKFVELIDFQQTPDRAVKVYSVARASSLLASVGYNPDDRLLRRVTTNQLVWVDPRFHTRPVLAMKHEREFDRTLSSHVVSIGDAKLTVLSSRNNSLLSVYDESDNNDGLVQSHTLPCSLSGCFPNGPHSGFCMVQPRQGKMEFTWPSSVHRLNTDSRTQKPDVGRLRAGLFSPIDATESVYPAENADVVYQTLDAMPLFWKQAGVADEHLLTMYPQSDSISPFAPGKSQEPAHESRADILTQSALSSRRGCRALAQGRVTRETLINGAGWHFNIEPALRIQWWSNCASMTRFWMNVALGRHYEENWKPGNNWRSTWHSRRTCSPHDRSRNQSHQQPVTSSPITPSPTRKRAGKDRALPTQSQRPLLVATTAPPPPPPVYTDSLAALVTAISNSQPVITGILVGSQKEAECEQASELPSDSHAVMASTQCVPGPFGGRLPAGKKKDGCWEKEGRRVLSLMCQGWSG
ncbi:hypothetical protein BJY52DRAFT_1223106 [Lactarius psammicola]|nr:hypothetical protein BJY52DRAFT_1223106 [Lactarius psammicola]